MDLKYVPLETPDQTLYTDGSSFVIKWEHKSGYAIVTLEKVLESRLLPHNTSAQKAELTALTRALELSENQWVNGAIWNEGEL